MACIDKEYKTNYSGIQSGRGGDMAGWDEDESYYVLLASSMHRQNNLILLTNVVCLYSLLSKDEDCLVRKYRHCELLSVCL